MTSAVSSTPTSYQNHYQLRSVWKSTPTPYNQEELKEMSFLLSSRSCLTQSREDFQQTVMTVADLAKNNPSFFNPLKDKKAFYFAEPQQNLNMEIPQLKFTLVNTGFILACLTRLAAVLQGDQALLEIGKDLVPEPLASRLSKCSDFMKEMLQKNALEVFSDRKIRLQVQENLLGLNLVSPKRKVELFQELQNAEEKRVYQVLSKDPEMLSTLYNSQYQLQSLTEEAQLQGLSETNLLEIDVETKERLLTLVRTHFSGASSKKTMTDQDICSLVQLAADPSFIEECIKDQRFDNAVTILVHISTFVGLLAVVRADRNLLDLFTTLSDKISKGKIYAALTCSHDLSINIDRETQETQARMILENMIDPSNKMSPHTKLQVYQNMLHLGLIPITLKPSVFIICTQICNKNSLKDLPFYKTLSKDPALATPSLPKIKTRARKAKASSSPNALALSMVALSVLGAIVAIFWAANKEG